VVTGKISAIRRTSRVKAKGSNRTIDVYAEQVAGVKGKILATPGSQVDLDTIVKAGANRGVLLDLLARCVLELPKECAAEQMRSKQTDLKSITMKMRTLALEAERLADDSSTYLDLWSPFTNTNFEQYKKNETKRRVSLGPFQAMRDYADFTEKESASFGRCLRRNAQKERRLDVLWLLSWIHAQTAGNLFENELARLLTDASEAAGQAKNFSASQLRKDFERHVKSPRTNVPDISTP
jgi:hypothetical protein